MPYRPHRLPAEYPPASIVQRATDKLRDIELRMVHDLKSVEPSIDVVIRTGRQLETIERQLSMLDADEALVFGEAIRVALARASMDFVGAAERYRGSSAQRERAVRIVSRARRPR